MDLHLSTNHGLKWQSSKFKCQIWKKKVIKAQTSHNQLKSTKKTVSRALNNDQIINPKETHSMIISKINDFLPTANQTSCPDSLQSILHLQTGGCHMGCVPACSYFSTFSYGFHLGCTYEDVCHKHQRLRI